MFKNIWLIAFWGYALHIMIRENWDGSILQWSAFIVTSLALVFTGIDAWLGKRQK
jgi:hypothetical protein